MATSDSFPEPKPEQSVNSESISRVKLPTMFRLGLYQMGLSMMSILILGVLNRVMIQELAIPATIVGVMLAIPSFVAPTRIWFGQMSDAKPLFGLHRSGYIWVGTAVFAIASFLAVQVMWQLGNAVSNAGGWVGNAQIYGWVGLLALVFAVYGMAISASSTPFAALLVDVSEEDNRSKVVGVAWSMLMVGIIFGAIIASGLLRQLAADAPLNILQGSINRLFMIIPAIVCVLAIAGTFGIEKKYSLYSTRSTVVNREDSITLGKAWQVLTANRQTGIFFTFLLVMTLSLFMQDPVMEPYAGQVFKMPLSESTRLNAFSGMGTLIGLSLTGFAIAPRLGKRKTTKLGCVLVAICVGLIGIAGFSANPVMLKSGLFLFGLASGVLTTGAISLMLDLTAAETAGTFIGAWSLAQAMARGFSVIAGTAVLSLGKNIMPNLALAYGLVFALEAAGMIAAIWFLNRVNVQEFKTNAKQAIASILESELD
jgi:MFS transporter, BCD family, chlorophyll transporter